MTQAWRLDKEIRNISDRSLLKHIVTELTDFFFFLNYIHYWSKVCGHTNEMFIGVVD